MSRALLRFALSHLFVREEEELRRGGKTREDGDQKLLLSHTCGLMEGEGGAKEVRRLDADFSN